MPTKKCPFCAEEIQAEAIKCKHCSSMLNNDSQQKQSTTNSRPETQPPSKSILKTNIGKPLLYIFLIFFGFSMLSGIIDGFNDASSTTNNSSPGTARGEKKSKADGVKIIGCAKDEIKKLLKSPSTAKFPSTFSDGYKITNTSEYMYTVISYVDSQNSLGAMIRTNFDCTVRVMSNDMECFTACELLE